MTGAAAAAEPPGRAARPLALSPWRLSWPLIVGVVLFLTLVSTGGRLLLADPDSHWHIAVGQWILQNGKVPTVDSFSHSFAGQPWIAKEWLSQVLLALAWETAGWSAVAVLSAASIALSFALMMHLLMRDLRPLPATLFTLAAIVMSAPHFLARPHVLAFPLMLIWVAGLVRAVEERRAPHPALLIAMVLWANLHGGFTLGLVLCGAFALEAATVASNAGERRARLIDWAKFGAASILAACLTPYGPQSIFVTYRIFDLGDVLGMIAEWKSPDFQTQPLQEAVVLAALVACLWSGFKLPLVRLAVVIGLVHLFLKHARNAELLAMLAPLVVAPILARQWPSLRPHANAIPLRPARPYALILCVSLAALFAAGMVRFGGFRPSADTTPTAALAFVRETRLEGPVFNDYAFGGSLIHAGIPTYIDGRGELFGGDFIRRYAAAVNLLDGASLEALLDREAITWTFLKKDKAANTLLRHMPAWRLVYSDDVATIFVRQESPEPRVWLPARPR